ncbi:MAG: GFA family protein [Lautropia sp.]
MSAFCPTCGSPASLTFADQPDIFTVHAASLDDPGRFHPQAVTYTVSGHRWDRLDPALATFEWMPPG